MDKLDAPLLCPVGEPACSYLPELDRLRAEVGALLALARTDELTGLYNYRHFTQAMEMEMERTRRSGKPMCLIMFDLDHFKIFNDRWGHEFGNSTLVHTARLLMGTIRRLDIACRYGGEEFAIILPDTPLRAGIMLANRLREKIANSPLSPGGHEVSITASFGVDVYHPESRDDVSQFLQRTDSWLFEAKVRGRNMVCHSAVESESGVSQDERDLLLKSDSASD
ncbi:MAG: GGDEF domain-containing protein [Gammaproteobacteria bacterium]|nr:GGDEF domain-containing protein [Gammaproteobacteria bacterium]MDP2142364.1 GGDEF domain-containing protein [Gammaproteobacteria bacterium]MDP2348605.1 GGDEF domain-containing protein [Gammaproteobacteria bacterium]